MSNCYDASTNALRMRDRRAELAEQKLCINGKSHGPATCGVLCRWCREVHKRGVTAVLADPKMNRYRPPDYRRKKPKRNHARVDRSDQGDHFAGRRGVVPVVVAVGRAPAADAPNDGERRAARRAS